MIFIDYEKAFDLVSTESIIKAFKQKGIGNCYLQIHSDIFRDSTAQSRLHTSEEVPIEKGVRQGNSLLLKLFTALLENMFRNLKWETKELR